MREIPLTQGKVALVDDADYDWLSQYKWCALKKPNTFYAISGTKVKMHRMILGLTEGDGKLCDHRNSNGLDNQRHNLRECTHSENMRNTRKIAKASSCYKGVSWHPTAQKWQVMIQIEGRNKNLGLYLDEIGAARVYDIKAKEVYGKFARLNFPDTIGALSAYY